MPSVPSDVALDLRRPVGRIVARAQARQPPLQITPVPEVPVAENSYARRGEDDVGATRQRGHIDTVAPQPRTSKGPAQLHSSFVSPCCSLHEQPELQSVMLACDCLCDAVHKWAEEAV